MTENNWRLDDTHKLCMTTYHKCCQKVTLSLRMTTEIQSV